MEENKYISAPMHKVYYSVSLPMFVVDDIRKVIDQEPRVYRNVPDFVLCAVREKLNMRDTGIETYQKEIIELQKQVIKLQDIVLKK